MQAEEASVPEKEVTVSGEASTNESQVVSTERPAPPPVVERKLSAQLQELLKMAERGLGDEVLIAWVKNSPTPFNLSPDDIVYLTDLGISEAVVRALIEHQGLNAPAPTAPSINPPVTEPAPSQPAVTAEPAPSVAITATPEFETAPQIPQDQSQITYVQQPAPVQVNYFYSSLAPYGSWIEVPDYGLCWRPTVAVIDSGWRPYCHRGRWVYSNCGWYWQSDYSWGWAPFHYGRWWNHPRSGWVWAADTVWSPAWVTWRYSDAYCGWAPLPPGCGYRSGIGLTFHSAGISVGFDFGLNRDCYTFVPSRRFHDRSPWRHALNPHQVVNVYNRTTVINNITHNRDNTLVNEGPGRDRIARITRSEIPKVTLRDVPAGTLRNIRSTGKELGVYRPLNPTLPTEGSSGSMTRHEVAKTSVAMSPRAAAGTGQTPMRTIGSTRSTSAPTAPSLTRLSPDSSRPTSAGTVSPGAAVSKSAVENRGSSFASSRRTLNNTVPVVRAPTASAPTPSVRENGTSALASKPSIDSRNGTISSQPGRIAAPINPSLTREASRIAAPTPAIATPANVGTIINSSRPNYSQPAPVSSSPIRHRSEAVSKSSFEDRSVRSTPSFSIRSVPSDPSSSRGVAPQPITPPLINQRPPVSSRSTVSSRVPVATPNSPAPYVATSRPAPGSAAPTYRQEVTKPTIVSSPRPQGYYSAPAPVTRVAPQSPPRYSPGPSIQNVPRSSPGPISAPQPSRASPVYSAPRPQPAAPSSAPRAVTSQPSGGRGRADRSSVR